MATTLGDPSMGEAASAVQYTSPASAGLIGKAITIDASIHQHLNSAYWNWLDHYSQDRHSHPLQHPEVVLAQLASSPASTLPAALVETKADTRSQGVGTLLPARVNSRRIGAWPVGQDLRGFRLAGGRFHAATANRRKALLSLFQAALQHVQKSAADYLVIDDLEVESELHQLLQTSPPPGWIMYYHAGQQPRRKIRLPADPQDYWNQFSSKTRQTFRRKLKKCGDTKLVRFTDIDTVPTFLKEAHEVSKSTWQTRQFGLRVENNSRELAVFTKLAELGMFRGYLWYIGQQAVAFTIGFQSHGCFHYEEVGYLTEHARVSPGQMMLIQMIDDLMTYRPVQLFDFGGGDADYKQMFSNETTTSGTVWLLRPSVRGILCGMQLKCSQLGRRQLRQLAESAGWSTWLRQRIRYGKKSEAGQPRPTTLGQEEVSD